MATIIAAVIAVPLTWLFLKVSDIVLAGRDRRVRCSILWIIDATPEEPAPEPRPATRAIYDLHDYCH